MSFKVIAFLISSFIFLSSCEHNMSIEQGSSEINEYLHEKYKGRFKLEEIEKDISQDLFKHQVGFKVWLIDTSNFKFGPIFFQKNKYQDGWITYGGTNVLETYNVARQGK